MSGFSAEWLRLREPFDHQARQRAWPGLDVPARMAALRAQTAGGVLTVIDLACGSGANLRELAPRLGGPQRWQLVDHDPALLAALADELDSWARRCGYAFTGEGSTWQLSGPGFSAEVSRRQTDLARHLDTVDFGGAQLVTASALLDLVSEPWLAQLSRQGRHAGAALLFALNVDGRTQWEPADPDDAAVHARFAWHQQRDKGFGPALGPLAVARAVALLARAGYEVTQAASDWVIEAPSQAAAETEAPGLEAPMGTRPLGHAGPRSARAGDTTALGTAGGAAAAQPTAMLAAMVDGMADAAIEHDPAAMAQVQAWRSRRQALLGTTRLRVGHTDLIATCR